MKKLIIKPKQGTKYKYKLDQVLKQMVDTQKIEWGVIANHICSSVGISRQTFYRWRYAKHETTTDIPTSALIIIIAILAKYDWFFTVDQLLNFTVIEEG